MCKPNCSICLIYEAALEATVPKEENEAIDTDERTNKEDGVPNEESSELLDTSTAAEEDASQENGGGELIHKGSIPFRQLLKYFFFLHSQRYQEYSLPHLKKHLLIY